MTLSYEEQELATFLKIPNEVVERAKSMADRPLRGILYNYATWDDRRKSTNHITPLLCVPCPLSDAYRRVLYLQSQLQPLSYVSFIIARSDIDYVPGTTFNGDPIRALGINRCYIAIYEGDDPFYILHMQATRLYGGGWGPIELINLLKRWSHGCQITILGASVKWLILYFHTLPADLLSITREACDLSASFFETYLNMLIAEDRLPEDIDPDDYDEEAERTLINERAAEEIRKSRVMFLSYY